MARFVANRLQRGFGDIQQRPQQPHAAARRGARHARQAGDAAAAGQAKQNRFGLIVGVMRGHDGAFSRDFARAGA